MKIDREHYTLTQEDVTKILEALPIKQPLNYSDTCIITIEMFINYDYKKDNAGNITLDFIE